MPIFRVKVSHELVEFGIMQVEAVCKKQALRKAQFMDLSDLHYQIEQDSQGDDSFTIAEDDE